MTQSFNQVQLIGRLGRDPELRYLPSGQAIARFSLATDRPARAGTQPETDWHEIVCWEGQAEFAGQYLVKGRLVLVVGALLYRSWTGKDGQQRKGAEIRASRLVPLDSRPEPAPAAATGAGREGERDSGFDPHGEDVPF